MGRSFLVFIGYQYILHEKNSKLLAWAGVKDKCGKCGVKLKTNLQYEIFEYGLDRSGSG